MLPDPKATGRFKSQSIGRRSQPPNLRAFGLTNETHSLQSATSSTKQVPQAKRPQRLHVPSAI
jgi:hypothetical protein